MSESVKWDFQANTADAQRQLEQLKGSLGGMGKQSDDTSSQWGSLSSQLTASVLVYQQVAAAVTKVADALVSVAEEFERQSGIINRFTGDISEAQERTRGLTSDLDLMVASNKAAQAGLKLSAKEFANVAVVANEFAAATGGDATAAMNQLIQAVSTGRQGALRQYGIDLTGITGLQNQQAEALRQLNEKYGEQSSSADTLGGQLGVLQTQLDNMTTEFYRGLNAVEPMLTAFEKLGVEIDNLANSFGVQLPGAMELTRRIAAQIGAQITVAIRGVANLVDGVRLIAEAAQQLATGDFSRAADAALAAYDRIGKGTERLLAAGFAGGGSEAAGIREGALAQGDETGRNAGAGGAGEGVGRGGRGGRGGGGGRDDGAATNLDELEAFLDTDGLETLVDLQVQQADMIALQAEQAEQLRAKEDEITAQLKAQNEEREALQEAARQKLETEEAILKKQREQAAAEAQRRQTIAQTLSLVNQGTEAALEIFKANEGTSELFRGFSQVAQAIGSYPDGFGIAQHAISAGLHFANAARLGVGGGGGGGQANAAAGAARNQGNARPVQGPTAGGGSAGGGTTTININAPTSEAMLGVQLDRAREAAASRFGKVSA